MEFTFSFWTWVGLISNLATIATSLAIFLIILGIVRWHRANLWLSLFLFSLFGQVTSGQFTNILFWIHHGNPLTTFWVSLSFFSLNGVILFAFASSLLGVRGRTFRVALALGGIGCLVAISFIFQGMVVTNVWLNEAGLLRYEITTLGYVLSLLPFTYQAATLGLLIHHRQRLEENWVTFGVAALMIGPILNILWVDRLLGVSIPFTALGPLIGISIIGYVVTRRQIFEPLRQLTFELEHQVAERTQQLEQASEELRLANEALNRRAEQLSTIIHVTREVASILDLDQLLHQAVELIHSQLGYFHVALYLVDDRHQEAVLRAAAGETDHSVQQTTHRLRADTPLGYVAVSGEPRLMPSSITPKPTQQPGDVRGHSLPPEAETGLLPPLKVESHIIGILELQSTEETFSEGEMTVLQTMTDHLAATIESARLLHHAEAQLQELASLQRRYSQQVWQGLPDSLALVYRQHELQTGNSAIQQLKEQGLPFLDFFHRGADVDGEEEKTFKEENGLLTVPVKLRGETVGVLGFRKDDSHTGWSSSEKALIESIVSQMVMALENARLLQEAQRLATREQQINLISARARSSVNLETILQNTVRELGKATGASRAFIQLGLEPHEALSSDAS